MTKIPNAILKMAYLKLYIPLSMLTTSALSKVCSNNSLKYHKILFGNGAGHQLFNKSIFLPKNSLSESLSLQAYHNWLTIINIVLSPEVAVIGINTTRKCYKTRSSQPLLKHGVIWIGTCVQNSLTTHSFLTQHAQHTSSSLNTHKWTLFLLRLKKLMNKVGCVATAHFKAATKILVMPTAVPMIQSLQQGVQSLKTD